MTMITIQKPMFTTQTLKNIANLYVLLLIAPKFGLFCLIITPQAMPLLDFDIPFILFFIYIFYVMVLPPSSTAKLNVISL